jgi:hypothetical protein
MNFLSVPVATDQSSLTRRSFFATGSRGLKATATFMATLRVEVAFSQQSIRSELVDVAYPGFHCDNFQLCRPCESCR